MFERLELTFEEPISYGFPIHFETDINKILNRVKGVLTIVYNETENKTYCYYTDESGRQSNKMDFFLQGKALIEELENTGFRDWNLMVMCDQDSEVRWTIKFNDKNKQSQICSYANVIPKEFYDFISILESYFTNTKLFLLKELPYYKNEESFKKTEIPRSPNGWKASRKTLKQLKSLVSFIPLLEGRKEFGLWNPMANSPTFYSNDNYITYETDVQNFKNKVLEIAEKCEELDAFNMLQIHFLPDYEQFFEKSDEFLVDNRSAILFLIKYIDNNCNDKSVSSYIFNESLKEGIIVKILKFIKEYNHF